MDISFQQKDRVQFAGRARWRASLRRVLMDIFLSSWLPNIVCTIAGCVLSWGIGYAQGKSISRLATKQSRMIEKLLLTAERDGKIELARDKDGNITGGENITLRAEAGAFVVRGGNVELTTGPAAGHGA